MPHVYGTSGLIVNKKAAPDANDYKDLLNPKYSGRISYRLKRPTLIALAFAMGEDPFALYASPAAYQLMLAKVEKDLIAAKPLVKLYWSNGDALLQAMRSGEVNVAMAWDNGGWKLHAENPDIDFVAPKSGALGWIDTFAIPAKAKNVDAAYQWINFMLRPENAAVFTNAEKYGTASKGAIQLCDKQVRGNFERSFTAADIDNIKWYPPVPAKLQSAYGNLMPRSSPAWPRTAMKKANPRISWSLPSGPGTSSISARCYFDDVFEAVLLLDFFLQMDAVGFRLVPQELDLWAGPLPGPTPVAVNQ